MAIIEEIFSDNEGNHLMVALDFCDDIYKQGTLQIPEEFADVDIVDISIEKVYLSKPINPIVFFKMSSWLLSQFETYNNAIFTYICSTDELATNHLSVKPQKYRWLLFDRLLERINCSDKLNCQDVIVGTDEYQTFGRAFYRDRHAPIIHIVTSHLEDKQNR